jgi:antirestriction protein ArdC
MNNYERITAAIQNALSSDLPAWRKPWRTIRESGAATIPRNAITGHSYRGINVPLLWCRQDQDMRFLTYRQASEHGGHVKRGGHGQTVVFWQKRQLKSRDDNGEETERSALLLKTYTVFNISQTDGVQLPKVRDAVAPQDPPVIMVDVFAKLDATVRHGGDQACYAPGPDVICMPRPEAFSSPDAYAATGLHEAGHWTGHKARLARDLTGRFGSRAYSAEELIAELTSAFLSATLGVDSSLENHASYIASWRELLKADPRAVFTAASKAQAASDFILAKIRPAETEEPSEEAAEVQS